MLDPDLELIGHAVTKSGALEGIQSNSNSNEAEAITGVNTMKDPKRRVILDKVKRRRQLREERRDLEKPSIRPKQFPLSCRLFRKKEY